MRSMSLGSLSLEVEQICQATIQRAFAAQLERYKSGTATLIRKQIAESIIIGA
jgi:hypothetical protein